MILLLLLSVLLSDLLHIKEATPLGLLLISNDTSLLKFLVSQICLGGVFLLMNQLPLIQILQVGIEPVQRSVLAAHASPIPLPLLPLPVLKVPKLVTHLQLLELVAAVQGALGQVRGQRGALLALAALLGAQDCHRAARPAARGLELALPREALLRALQILRPVGQLVVVDLAGAPRRDAQLPDRLRRGLLDFPALDLDQELCGPRAVAGDRAVGAEHAFREALEVLCGRLLAYSDDYSVCSFRGEDGLTSHVSVENGLLDRLVVHLDYLYRVFGSCQLQNQG